MLTESLRNTAAHLIYNTPYIVNKMVCNIKHVAAPQTTVAKDTWWTPYAFLIKEQ